MNKIKKILFIIFIIITSVTSGLYIKEKIEQPCEYIKVQVLDYDTQTSKFIEVCIYEK